MIAPNGQIKNQINQGSFKNQTVWDSDLFKHIETDPLLKIAIVDPLAKSSNPVQNDVNRALDSGNMRGNNIPKSPELKKDFGNPSDRMQGTMPSAKGVGPSNNNNLSPFLQPDGSEEQEQEIGLQQEKMKLRQAAGPGFLINLKRSKEGAFELIILPPEGYKIPKPDEFAAVLMKAVQGTAEDLGDPDPRTGAMKIVYKSQQVGPQKVMKSNKR